MASLTLLAAAPGAVFPPAVAIHVVGWACERPDLCGHRLAQGDCAELARQLIAEGLVADIAAATIRRIWAAHQLKPWRHHLWQYPKHPRDAEFDAMVADVIDLYRRPLCDDEIVLSLDEKTSLQPRPRLAPTRPAQPQNLPNRDEHEYKRTGALNICAAFNTRSGQVYGQCYERQRQLGCIAFLEYLDQEMAEHIRTIHLVCDHVSTHHGQDVTR
jgi:DDE superfamily endonuclease